MRDLHNLEHFETEEDRLIRKFNEEKRYLAVNITFVITLLVLVYNAVVKFI